MKQPKSKIEKTEPEMEIKGPQKAPIQIFEMVRNFDESGISGIGVVLQGCVFSNNWVSICWVNSAEQSITTFMSFEAFKAVHIDPHPKNQTEIRWLSVYPKEE